MKIAQLQMLVGEEKRANRDKVLKSMEKIKEEHIDMLMLPEMFTTPYDNSYFASYAEADGGETWQFCSQLAKCYHIYLSAGSIPEIDAEGNIYNTAYVFDREGRQIAKHRKVHLFDIDIKGGQYFKESDTLTAGNQCTVFDTEFGKMGVCICFDCRFPELIRLMVDQGANIILVPASFNTTTGPAHWELMFRMRAVDNQCYMIGTSCARDDSFSYHAWGHSLVVSPWGDVLSELDEKENIAISEIDLSYVEKIREQLPLLCARRRDIY